jgi:two-component system NtrC family response regulator
MPNENAQEVMSNAQMLLNNNLSAAAKSLLDTYPQFKLQIIDGKVVDTQDMCQIYLDKFVTVNKQMLEMKDDVKKLADTEHEVLIIGPTGTGKELIAQALHSRREGKFRTVNCAGLPEHLVESELFGYEQGAFTGALKQTMGLMESARDGTLFLDEINSLPMHSQGKLLRALQSKVIRRVGGKNDIAINCRFVCASNIPISKMCGTNLFRTDLYARISTFELHTICLDDRLCDVPLIYKALGANDVLINHIITYINDPKNGLETWFPFNVRTVQQHIKRYKILGKLP